MDTNEDIDIASTNSSKRMYIIQKTPNKFNSSFHYYNFDHVSFVSLYNTSYNDVQIEELEIIPMDVRSTKELLSNKKKL